METPSAAQFLTWIRRIGAKPGVMPAAEHDAVVAYTSHLAQLSSTALASAVADSAAPGQWRAAGSRLADSSRPAVSSYDLWRDILATNACEIERALGVYIQKLEHIRDNLRTRQLQEEFDRGRELAARLREKK